MFCSKCGSENREGSKFCAVCGASFNQPAPEQPPVQQYAPPPIQYGSQYGYYQGYGTAAPKKKRKGLIIGLIAGIAVLLGGAAALYFLVFAVPECSLTMNSAKSAVSDMPVTNVPAAPADITLTPSEGFIKISWSASDSAAGYEIYRAQESGGSYKIIGNTKELSYTDTGVTAGETYYYKVRAYRTSGGSYIYGSYTKAESGKSIAKSSANSSSKGVINLYSYTKEVPDIAAKYAELHPDFGYTINPVVAATSDGSYEPMLDQALTAGGTAAPDIYCAESAFVLKYTQGDLSEYAIPYADLGIDVNGELAAANIAQYTVDIGTRPSDRALVGLGYEATGSAFIYRRSIAKKVWGTDDPAVIALKVGPGWNQFFKAAEVLKAKGYSIVSGEDDIWKAAENSADAGWINADGKLYIDPKRAAFLDQAKIIVSRGYSNGKQQWSADWFADMGGTGAKGVFGFMGPAWMINYVMASNAGNTSGDWAICTPPAGFFWGGTWLMANKSLSEDPAKKAAVKDLIDWITLQSGKDSLQYAWANGTLYSGLSKDCVASGTVMAMSDGKIDLLGGQNMFDVLIPANQLANGKNLTIYDQTIGTLWLEQVHLYAAGSCTRDQAIAAFKNNVKSQLGIDAAQ